MGVISSGATNSTSLELLVDLSRVGSVPNDGLASSGSAKDDGAANFPFLLLVPVLDVIFDFYCNRLDEP